MNYEWHNAVKLEHEVARIITQQEINGWKFDIEGAKRKISWLQEQQQEIYGEIRPLLRVEVLHDRKPVNDIYTRAGNLLSRVERYWGDDVSNVSGSYSPVEFIEPDLGSRQKVIKQLTHIGWKAIEYTEKGNPKLTEESLSFLHGGLGKRVAKWYIYNHRLGQLKGWFSHLREDGRITAGANPLGTPTSRMRHSVIVNVPKAKSHVLFGREMRECFTVEEGYKLIGHDASGLEARMLAHYMNNPELTHEIIDGDFHTKIWTPINEWVHSRDQAKNIEYALLYGAQDFKLGTMTDVYLSSWSKAKTQRMGSDVRRAIMGSIPALGDLTTRVQTAAGRGWLRGLDGRKVPVRSKHAALNTLNQSSAAIVMKVSMCYLDKWLKREGITLNEVKKVADYHDEAQAEVLDDERIIELYSRLAVQSIKTAGIYLNLRCPLDAEAIVGNNWSQTH